VFRNLFDLFSFSSTIIYIYILYIYIVEKRKELRDLSILFHSILYVVVFVHTQTTTNTQHRIHQPSLSQFYITTICNYNTPSPSLSREIWREEKESHQTLSLSHFTLYITSFTSVCSLGFYSLHVTFFFRSREKSSLFS
jgi:hypothetical protein